MGIIFRNGRKYSGTRVVDDADHLFAEDTTGTSVSAQTMLTNILGDFATMEDSVAQENHSVGDYIVLGSYFYKVTDAITAGDTLVEGVNGNIERTNVGAEVSNLDSKFAWKEFGYIKGSSYYNIQAIGYFNELLLEVQINSTNNRELFQVPRNILSADGYLFLRQGGFGTSTASNSCYVTVGVSLHNVYISGAYLFGTEYTSNSIIRVLYR